jgi:hypothetical protein
MTMAMPPSPITTARAGGRAREGGREMRVGGERSEEVEA